MVARTLEAAGVDRVVTMDLHAGQLQGFFGVPVDRMTALKMLADHFAGLDDDLVVVALDAGRVKLNKQFATRLGAGLAILDKDRPRHQATEIGHVIGDVHDKTAIIGDDIIDTAGTLRAAAEAVVTSGARRIFAAATHTVFAGRAYENRRSSPLERILVADTIPLRPDVPASIDSCHGLRYLPTPSAESSPTTRSAQFSAARTIPSDFSSTVGPGPSRGTVLFGRTATPGVPNTRAGRAATRSGR